MSSRSYHVPPAGHPPQTELLTGRAVFTEAYAVIPKGVIRDIVASYLPHWDHTRVWVLARPLSGLTETKTKKQKKQTTKKNKKQTDEQKQPSLHTRQQNNNHNKTQQQ